MMRIKVELETLSPVVLTKDSSFAVMTETREQISGSELRGIMASRYITAQNLDKKNAHNDMDFRRAFFGGLRFTALLPVSASEKVARVLPHSLLVNKEKTDLKDLLVDKPLAGYKPLDGLAEIDETNNTLCRGVVSRSVALHMSRSSDDERLAGKSNDGNIYNYESVDAGQRFVGEVIGDEEVLSRFQMALGLTGDTFLASVGRSRFTQYGKCRLRLFGIEPLPKADTPAGDTLFLVLDAPFLPLSGESQDAQAALREIVDELNRRKGENVFSLVENSVFASLSETENFVGVWGMRRPRITAVASGSVFGLACKGGFTLEAMDIVDNLLHEGIGLRTEEGFGRMSPWTPKKWTLVKAKPEIEDVAAFTNQAKAIACSILEKRVERQLRLDAYEDAQNLTGLSGTAHFFSRLIKLLGTQDRSGGAKARFLRVLDEKLNDGTALSTHLNNVKIRGTNMKAYLDSGNMTMPYEGPDHGEEKALSGLDEDILKQIGFTGLAEDTKFYVYWFWLMRHAHKRATKEATD